MGEEPQKQVSPTDCYDLPKYWDLAFSDDTKLEADFLFDVVKRHCDFPLKSAVEPGCGGGRLLEELASRGVTVSGWDLSEDAVQWAGTRLQKRDLPGSAVVADMRTHVVDPQVDLAYCLVNTFRHLLNDEDAITHLQSVARSLRPGGLYVVGLHLLPPDADLDDEEEWSVTEGDITVTIQLTAMNGCRERREETLRFVMTVEDPSLLKESGTLQFQSDYHMRTWEAGHIQQLLTNVPEFELRGVFDFWYEIDEPLELSDELGDTVLVLQRL